MTNEETPQWQPVKGRGKKRNILLISAAILLIFAVSAFVAYFKYDVWKSPKNIYLETEFVNFMSLSDEVKDSLELVSKSLTNNIRTQDELSFQINTRESLGESGDKIIELLNQTSLMTDSVINDKDKKLSSKLAFKTDSEQWLELALAAENDVLALSIPTIDANQFLKLDLKNENLQEKLGTETALPKRIVNFEEWMKVLQVDNKEWARILSNVLDAYVQNISDEQVQIEKDITYKLGGQSIATRKLTLTFTPKQLDRMMDDMYKNIVLNKEFQQLIYGKYLEIIKLFKENGVPVYDKLTKEEMVKAMEQLYDELKVDSSTTQLEDVHMTLYIDGDKQIISRQIHLADEEMDVVVGLDRLDVDQMDLIKVDVNAQDKKKDEGLRFSLESSKTGEESDQSQDLKLNLTVRDELQPLEIDWTSTLDTKLENQQKKQNLEFTFNFKSTETDNVMLSGNWSEDRERVGESTNYAYKLSLDLDKPGSALVDLLPVKDLEVVLKGKRTNPERIELPKLTDRNSLDIANATDEELSNASEAYFMKAIAFYTNNQQRLTFLDSFLE
jgi:hypothetical protein